MRGEGRYVGLGERGCECEGDARVRECGCEGDAEVRAFRCGGGCESEERGKEYGG
jgi:hypothetical protein